MGNHDDAIADFSEALQRNPDNAVFYNNRGTTYHKIGKYKLAIADYDRALNLNPEFAMTFNNRGNAYHQTGQHDRAIPDFNRAIQLDQKIVAVYNNRGMVFENKGQLENAIEDYSKAIQLNPNYAKATTIVDRSVVIRVYSTVLLRILIRLSSSIQNTPTLTLECNLDHSSKQN